MWGFAFLVLDGSYCCAVVSFTMLAVTDAAADVLTITTIRLIAMIIVNINITERSMDCGPQGFLGLLYVAGTDGYFAHRSRLALVDSGLENYCRGLGIWLKRSCTSGLGVRVTVVRRYGLE